VGVADVVAGEGSEVWLINCQNRSEKSKQIQMTTTSVYRDAVVKTFLLNLGSAWNRSELVTHLLETGAACEMLGASVLNDHQEIDQRTLQHHEAPHTRSDLLFKNALFDASRSIFSGLIQVDENAHYTDAYQTCRNLLGSDDAEANSMPGLEINADQVKCSHGATAGQADEEELFYLMSRGIDGATARELISFGFTSEVVERVGDKAIEAMMLGLIEEKFRALRF
jgi:Fe-S cluster assembly protein SufD